MSRSYFYKVKGLLFQAKIQKKILKRRQVKNLPASARDMKDVSSIPGLGRSPGEENGYPLQYSCLESSRNIPSGHKGSDTAEGTEHARTQKREGLAPPS